MDILSQLLGRALSYAIGMHGVNERRCLVLFYRYFLAQFKWLSKTDFMVKLLYIVKFSGSEKVSYLNKPAFSAMFLVHSGLWN